MMEKGLVSKYIRVKHAYFLPPFGKTGNKHSQNTPYFRGQNLMKVFLSCPHQSIFNPSTMLTFTSDPIYRSIGVGSLQGKSQKRKNTNQLSDLPLKPPEVWTQRPFSFFSSRKSDRPKRTATADPLGLDTHSIGIGHLRSM